MFHFLLLQFQNKYSNANNMNFSLFPFADFSQMQCIRAFVAQQPDELSLEKADVLLIHQQSSDGELFDGSLSKASWI